ncbi:MAG TPA: radical SAM protein [Bacteroidales bacterium]|nr:radical SAM protein [Bacteroidales bacterium]
MSESPDHLIDDRMIISLRGNKNPVDPKIPYGWLIEKELTRSGKIEETGIIFLTNRECAFHCLMCDLWKNTTDYTIAVGDIPRQIEWALEHMPGVKQLKLYNSGSFFDKRAIPEEDYQKIASLLKSFETVIVESHPRLINEKCLKFRDMLEPELQVSIGLETVNPDILKKLNKQMSIEDFASAVSFLSEQKIASRAFILLRPPWLNEEDGVFWAERSIEFAFKAGVECCTVIPVRAGNGAMDFLMENGEFSPPDIHSLEIVLEYGIGLKKGRVFADTWDLGLFSKCPKCLEMRIARLSDMNLTQVMVPPVNCSCIS